MCIRLIIIVTLAFAFIPVHLFPQWESSSGFPVEYCTSFVQKDSRLFATTWGNGLKYSDNNGQTWNNYPSYMMNISHGFFQSSFVYGPDIIVGGYGSLYFSNDNGSTWSDTKLTNFPIRGFAISKDSNGNSSLFMATGYDGVWRKDTSYYSWIKLDSAPKNPIYTGAITTMGNNIYVGTGGNGIFLSNDNGNNWKSINTGLTNESISILSVVDSNIIAGTYGGVFISSNNGVSWSSRNNGLTDVKVTAMAITGNNIFIGTSSGGVYFSMDKGNNWKQVNTGLLELFIYALYVNADYVYASTYNYVWRRPIIEIVTSVNNSKETGIKDFILEQNYPNPFNPTTVISFSIPEAANVQLAVYDYLGRKVAVLVDEFTSVGTHEIPFDASKLSSGIYFYKIISGKNIVAKKMLLLK